MTLLNLFGIANAYAASTTAPAHHGGILGMLWLPLLLIVVFYFLLIRPQSKRAKEHRSLLENIALGDEVVTAGGIVGRVARLKDNFIVIEIAKGTELTLQKASIASVLPKGTIESL